MAFQGARSYISNHGEDALQTRQHRASKSALGGDSPPKASPSHAERHFQSAMEPATFKQKAAQV